MKGFLTALIIFLFLIVFLFCYAFYMEETLSSLSLYIRDIESAIATEDFSAAGEIASEFREDLMLKAGILCYLTDRALIDDAFTECEKLISFITTKDQSESLASASGIRMMIEKTKEKSIIRFPG